MNTNLVFTSVRYLTELSAVASNAVADLDALVQIVKAGSPVVSHGTLEAFFDAGGVVALALDSGRIVASVYLIRSVKANGSTLRVEHVATLPRYERRGIARALLELLHEKHFTAGDRYIDLSCEPFRTGANKLYESLGYSVRETNSRRKRFQGASS